MEKKNAKKSTAKKVVKENSEVIIKNQIDYSGLLTKIFYCLIALIVITGVQLVITIAALTTTTIVEESNTNDTYADYDVSSFNEMTASELVKSLDEGETHVVYVGRATCGYCVKFLPIMKQAQEDLGYTTTYINIEEVTQEDYDALASYSEDIANEFGSTPMVIVFKDGQYSNVTVGYQELDTFEKFLNDAGIEK